MNMRTTRLRVWVGLLLIAMTIGAGVTRAAESFFPFFEPYHDRQLPGHPCAGQGGLKAIAPLVVDDVLRMFYHCEDGNVIARTDRRAVAQSDAIHLNQDPIEQVGFVLHGQGWAFECHHSITSAVLVVDGRVDLDAVFSFGAYRPDVQAAYASLCPNQSKDFAGFEFRDYRTGQLPPGPHTFVVRISDDSGRMRSSNPVTFVTIGRAK